MPHDPSQTQDPPQTGKPQKLSRIVLDDLNQMDFRRTMREDLQEIYQFYLDADTRDRLDEMDRFSRWCHLTGWLLKNSILKLPPVRRLLLLGGMVLFLWGLVDSVPGLIMGFLLVILTLILELKDKLLAQDELMTGRAVQFALMPKQHPTLPGWETWLFTRPAKEVGGDLVDYLAINEDRLGLALGDVAGKGAPAALFGALAMGTLRARVSESDCSPASMLQEMNRHMLQPEIDNRFVAMAFGIFDPAEKTLTLANAGITRPVLVRDHKVVEIAIEGVPLGLLPDSTYDERTLQLQTGDFVIFTSDGITEAQDTHCEEFSQRRMEALLAGSTERSAQQLADELMDASRAFALGTPPELHDDRTVVVLKVR